MCEKLSSHLTFSKSNSRIFCVNGVQNSFIANLGLRDKANFTSNVWRPSTHIFPLFRLLTSGGIYFLLKSSLQICCLLYHRFKATFDELCPLANAAICYHDMAVFIFLAAKHAGKWADVHLSEVASSSFYIFTICIGIESV